MNTAVELSDSSQEIRLKRIHIAGIRGKVFDLCIKSGRFESIEDVTGQEGEQEKTEEALWIAPGLIDLHFHAGWTDFIHSRQEQRTEEEVCSMICEERNRLLQEGVTMIRDAGGLAEKIWQKCEENKKQGSPVPDIILCADMIPAKEGLDRKRLEAVFESSQEWVKVMAAGGISTETEHVLDPNISEASFKNLIDELHAHGKRVMVHTWGGQVLDWIIDAEADSVEHGIFMTRQQARSLAEKRIPYVATTRIYQMIAAGREPLVLPSFLRERAQTACAAHKSAVRYALEEGVEIGFGTDFYSGDNLVPNELEELFSLQEYGLSVEQAWNCATETAARILGIGDFYGKIAEGYVADAVIFRGDPYAARNAEVLRQSIVRVLKSGSGNT